MQVLDRQLWSDKLVNITMYQMYYLLKDVSGFWAAF